MILTTGIGVTTLVRSYADKTSLGGDGVVGLALVLVRIAGVGGLDGLDSRAGLGRGAAGLRRGRRRRLGARLRG